MNVTRGKQLLWTSLSNGRAHLSFSYILYEWKCTGNNCQVWVVAAADLHPFSTHTKEDCKVF